MTQHRKAEKALDKAFQKWLQDGSGGLKSEKDIEWLTDVDDDESYKWRWHYKGKNYIWKYVYDSGEIIKITF